MINAMYTAIAEKLESLFEERPTIYFDSLPQGFHAPCFFIKCVQTDLKQKLLNHYEMDFQFDVMYYPKDSDEDNVEELNSVGWLLSFGIEYIEFEGAPLRGTNISSRVTDDVQHVLITYPVFVRREMAKSPFMQKLIQLYQLKL